MYFWLPWQSPIPVCLLFWFLKQREMLYMSMDSKNLALLVQLLQNRALYVACAYGPHLHWSSTDSLIVADSSQSDFFRDSVASLAEGLAHDMAVSVRFFLACYIDIFHDH
jgi:hypothetical protein